MRVIFIYMSSGGSSPNNIPSWNPSVKASSKYLDPDNGLRSEGLYWMLCELLKRKVISDIVPIIESVNGSGSFRIDKHKGYIVPHLFCLDQIVRDDDIIFVRGGFRGWYVWLKTREKRNKLMLYAANTGRERWEFWDVILNDLNCNCSNWTDAKGRLWFNFQKPINPQIFYPVEMTQIYDVCIGASYIHDKKGQWRTVKVIDEFQRRFKKQLNCIMPGAERKGTKTNEAIAHAQRLGVHVSGMLNRRDLNLVYNQSKVFIHLGASGQNDRGPIEAMRCGCKLIIGSPAYHSLCVYENPKVTFVPMDKDDYASVAMSLKNILDAYKVSDRQESIDWYELTTGSTVIGKMTDLFSSLVNSNAKT